MLHIPQHLFVGALENVPNCTTATAEEEIFPKFLLMVILEGSQHFVIDGQHFKIDAGSGDGASPRVFMLNIAQFSGLRFIHDSDALLRKVMISAPITWLQMALESQQSMPSLRRFFSRHLAHFTFEPGQSILQIAEKIMHPPMILEGEVLSMYRQAQALDIMWQACLSLVAKDSETAKTPILMSLRQSERVRDYILANIDKDLTLDAITDEVGASASTVQRHFKEHFGLTIFDFVRSNRLEIARTALENDGIPVSRAAYLAGYNNVASFTTAFRKTYGLTPRQVRA